MATAACVGIGLVLMVVGVSLLKSDQIGVIGALLVFGPIYVLPVYAWLRNRRLNRDGKDHED